MKNPVSDKPRSISSRTLGFDFATFDGPYLQSDFGWKSDMVFNRMVEPHDWDSAYVRLVVGFRVVRNKQ